MDKRKCERKAVKGNVSGKIILKEKIDIMDLSRSGIRFKCHKKVDPNSTQRLKITMSDMSVSLKGLVVRSTFRMLKGTGGKSRPLYEVAMQFRNLTDEQIQSIKEFVRLLKHGKADRSSAR